MGVKQVKAVINGVTTVLTLNSSTGKYEATITAPAKSSYKQTGHYYPVSVTAEDLAGNTTTVNDTHSTLGPKLRLTVKVGNGTAQNVTITDGKFSGTFDLAAEGKNVVTFVSTSASGVTTTVTRNLYLDTVAPTISAVTITPNPVDAGKTYIISVSVTD